MQQHTHTAEMAGRMERTKRSKVWLNFTRLDLDNARCQMCNKNFACKGGNTSNLSKHLAKVHHIQWEKCTVFVSSSAVAPSTSNVSTSGCITSDPVQTSSDPVQTSSDPGQTSSDPVQTSSDGLCKLVRWAHSHGTICSLLPSLQQLTSHGTALTTEPGSHGSSIPVAVWSCADGHAYYWPLSEHSNANGGSGHTSNGPERFVGGRPSNKVTVKASCDLSYSEAASQGEQFSSGCDSSAMAEDDDYEPRPSRKRGGATGVALPVKKVKQEADSAEDCDSGM
ncbi:uncharacterized protein KIAA1958 [Trematomus bernacchii]|uniref:uncharacterized protein KIAA1958 n=1 Tax=Trematomus bernacchii TaxID=40690 RepID=UPI00146BAB6A|nr:uncharacterized protein KIAA1958 [Trematomus bernacchii]